jgi:long-chain acyl-CoA synthetase
VNCNRLAAQILLRIFDSSLIVVGENVEPLEIEEAAMRSNLIQQIVVIGQDQRRLGAIVIPNKEAAEGAAKQKISPVDSEVNELSKETITSMVYEELRKWTSQCSFQVGPVLIVDEPFTIDNGLMTPTMKIRRDKVVDQYKNEIERLYK